MCGERAEDKLPIFRRLLDAAGLRRRLEECARAGGKPIGELRVAIKPSFMLGYHRKDRSCLTDPELVRELARYLRAAGAGDVAVVESPNIYDQFYRHRSVPEVARYFDIPAPEFRLVDLGDDQIPHAYGRGMAQYSVGRTWRDADFRISFAKLRSHPVEHVHLSVANTEGLGMRCDHFLFAERQAQRESAVMTLLGDFPPHFALIEGYDLAPDGILGAMGSPRPKVPRRLYAGADALAVDVVAARHLGLRDPRQSSMLRAAFHWFGDPSAATQVVGPDEPVAGWRGPHHNELSSMLSFVAYPIYVFGSGRGALFVPEMDEEAFPPVTPPSLGLRVGRKLLQASLGLRFPR